MNVKRRDPSAPGWRAARRFTEWYQRSDVRQVDIAEALGIHQPQVSAVLRGARPLSVKLFDRVAALIGIPTSDLIAAEGASLWDQDEWPVVAEVHELPLEIRKAFVDQWRAALDAYTKGRADMLKSIDEETGRGAPGLDPKQKD